jgi:tRNA modification GTPase
MEGPGDTIAAVSTALGPSARAVVRLSGPRALECAGALVCAGPGAAIEESRGYTQRAVEIDVHGIPIPARITVFRKPRSFTGEDLVEIDLPGSLPVLAALLRRLLAAGRARLAHPGEFSLRAFLGGRLDLTQAEALGKLIHAGGEAEARAAYRQLGGELRRRVGEIEEAITGTLALVEAGIDFPDEDIPAVAPGRLEAEIEKARRGARRLLDSACLRIPERGALRVAILGHPNAGKSSMLNAAVGRPAALTSDEAGTTRDPVRASSVRGGIQLEWMDLAGLEEAAWMLGRPAGAAGPGAAGETGDGGEAAAEYGMARAIQRLSERELEIADLIVWVADGCRGGADDPLSGFDELPEKPRLDAVSKCDLLGAAARSRWRAHPLRPLLVSARTGEGLDELLERIAAHRGGWMAGRDIPAGGGRAVSPDAALLLSPLQATQLERAVEALDRAAAALRSGSGYELAAVDLRDALAGLAPLCGREVSERVLGAIFSQLCIGK